MQAMRRRVIVGLLLLVGGVWLLGSAEAKGPIKIGFIYPDSGPFAQVGIDMRDGFSLYLAEVGNKAGGRAIELVFETKGTNKPDEGLTKARKLVERDRVHILAGLVATPVAVAMRSYVVSQKVPFMLTIAAANDLTQKLRSEYIFRSSWSGSQNGHPLGDWAYKQGYRKAVIVASDYGAGHEMIGGFARVFTEAGGQVIQELYPPVGAPDFAPYLTQVRRDADVVAVFFGGSDALRFVNQYAEYGLKGKIPLVGPVAVTDETVLPRQGDNALGIVTTHPWSAALDTPGNKRFFKAYEARHQRAPTLGSETGYAGAQMIAQALEAIKGNIENKEAFLAALEKVEVDAPRGKVRLDAYHNPIETVYVRKVERKDGALQNSVIDSYPNVSQFWKWSPEAHMAMPGYQEMKGKWAR